MSTLMDARRRVALAAAVAALALAGVGACAPSGSGSAAPDATASVAPDAQMRDAIMAGDLAAATAALDAGLDPNADLGGGSGPIHRAASAGQSEIVQLLIDRGADIEATVGGKTPLMMAAITGDYDTVIALAEAGAAQDVQDLNDYGMLAFHHAARHGNVETLRAFLDLGTDPDVLENTQSTAIMYTAYNGHLEASQLLIDAGTDLDIRDQGGQTALYWARTRGYSEIAAIIEAAGGAE